MVHHIPNVEAKTQSTTHYKILIVKLSESCEKNLKSKISIGCPTIQELIPLDTSNKNISGKFVKQNDTWIREKPQVKNHYMFYGDSNKLIVCVECLYPSGSPDLVKEIIIEANNFVWPQRDQIVSNGKIIIHHNPYVSENCNTATLGYNYTNYKLLVETINYISEGCIDVSFIKDGMITIKDTPFNFNNPYSSLNHYNWLSQAKKINVGDCITKKCVQLPDPYKKKNW